MHIMMNGECIDRTKWFKRQQCNSSWCGVNATSLDMYAPLRIYRKDLDSMVRLAFGISASFHCVITHRIILAQKKINEDLFLYLELMECDRKWTMFFFVAALNGRLTRAKSILAYRQSVCTYMQPNAFDDWMKSYRKFNDIFFRLSSCLFWAQIIDYDFI